MCLSTHTYLFIFPLPEQCRGGRCPAHRKNNLQWGGKKKKKKGGGGGGVVKGKIYEYANLVTVWNLVMSGKCCCHLSLCRGHCLMPGSWAQILLYELPPHPHHHHHHYHHFCCHLIATWTKLQPGNTVHKKHTNARKALTNATGTRHLDVSVAIRKPKRKPCVVQFPD